MPEGVGTARATLQPLMLAYAFEAVERAGVLVFQIVSSLPVAYCSVKNQVGKQEYKELFKDFI